MNKYSMNDSIDAFAYYYSHLKNLQDNYITDPVVTSKPRTTQKVSSIKRKFQYIARD